MYIPGVILYFKPFHFKNGNTSKDKYFIVLQNDKENAVLASLPTSIDHVPSFIELKHGCINKDDINFNCYYFEKNRVIAENGFSFPKPTFVYGSQIDNYQIDKLTESYQVENIHFEIKGVLTKDEFKCLIKCFINSGSVKRKFKDMLRKTITD